MPFRTFAAIVVCIICAGCDAVPTDVPKDALVPRQPGESMARSHTVSVDVPEDKVASSVKSVVDTCAADRQNECTVLISGLTTGQYETGSVKLRTKPAGVEPIIQLASSFGTVTSQRTEAEDLAEAIADNESRLAMFRSYRERLQALEGKASDNIDSLIKIASEETRVQSEIEKLSGESAFQKRRIETEILNLSFFVHSQASFIRPISESLSSFNHDFSDGIANAIRGSAYVIPWLVLAVPVVLFLRFLLRRRKSS